jgi:hypothetical protein
MAIFVYSMQFQSKYIGLYIIIALQIVLGVLVIDKGHNWGGDFALYIDESKSIVDGRFLDFYKQNLFTIQNSHKTLAPIAEPIGAPLIFTPLIAIFGVNLYLLKYLILLFYIGIALVLWECLSLFKTINHIFKTCTLFFVLSYYEFSFLLETVNSDLPFTFFICLSILYYLKYSLIGKDIYLLFAILCGAFSYFIRDAGAAICGAFFFLGIWEFMIYKNWRKFLLYVFPFASILIFKLIFPPFNSNLFDDLISKITYERCIQPIYLIYENVSKNILPLNRLYNVGFLFVAVWMIIVTGLISFYKSQKKKFNVFISLFLMFYVFIHVFAGAIEERYFLIIQIIMLLFFLFGLYLIIARIKLTEKLILTIFIVVSIEAAAKDLVRIKNWCFTENYTFRNEVETTEALKTWSFIKKNTLPNDIVFFRKPTVLRLFTTRNSCVFLEDSIFVNRPNINFYQLDASCGNVKNHLQNVKLKRDTIFTKGKFQLIRLIPLNPKR